MKNETTVTTDVLNALLGIVEGSHLAALRTERAAATRHTQGSYVALFGDHPATSVTRAERLAAALRVAVLHDEHALIEHFTALLTNCSPDLVEVVAGASVRLPSDGLPGRLPAILKHVELLVLDPSAASPADLDQLRAAGLTAPEIVTVSQLVAFTSYLIRVYVGLALLGCGSKFCVGE